MAKNNFQVNFKTYCLLIDGDNWEVVDPNGKTPPEEDAQNPEFRKIVLDKFNELKTAGYVRLWFIDPRCK